MDSGDHRVIGKRLDLFHQQDDAPGMVFWHPRGTTLFNTLEHYIRDRMREAGFQEVRTPQLLERSLWEQSGHLEKFGAHMFAVEDGERMFALKPMSCPGHLQIFKSRVHSYRDLPVRFSEFGSCHRREPTGSLSGLMRTRAFTQDDAHVLCREEHIEREVQQYCALLRQVYGDFGFNACEVKLSTRPATRAGSDIVWDKAENALAAAARASALSFTIQDGEGAFYGPKLEFVLRDNRGRPWQCGTLQLDFVLPERLNVTYVDERNDRVRPVLIHHAVLGSLERFTAILLEHHEGRFPTWLAPEQVVVAPVSEQQIGYAQHVLQALRRNGLRVVLDARTETLARRVVDAHEREIPVFLTVGRREAQDGTVSVRRGRSQPEVMPLADAVMSIAQDGRR